MKFTYVMRLSNGLMYFATRTLHVMKAILYALLECIAATAILATFFAAYVLLAS